MKIKPVILEVSTSEKNYNKRIIDIEIAEKKLDQVHLLCKWVVQQLQTNNNSF
jgi:hypothetical protein